MTLLESVQIALAIFAVLIIFSFIAMFIDDKEDNDDEKWNS